MNTRPNNTVPPLRTYMVLICGIIGVSTGSIFARLADAPALVTAAYRVGLASLILLPLAGWKKRIELRNLSFNDLKLALLSGFFLAGHFASWISSLDYTSIANSVVLVNTIPLWVGIMTPLISQERLKKTTVVGIIFSIIGASIIGFEDAASGGIALKGDFLAIVGAVCAAVYLLLGRNLRRKLTLLSYVAICYGSAAAILWLIVLLMNLSITGFSTQTITAFWAMALISQIVGHSSYNWALKWFSAGFVAVALIGEPVGSTIMAYLIFNEGLTWIKIVGGVCVLFAIYIAASGEKRD